MVTRSLLIPQPSTPLLLFLLLLLLLLLPLLLLLLPLLLPRCNMELQRTEREVREQLLTSVARRELEREQEVGGGIDWTIIHFT